MATLESIVLIDPRNDEGTAAPEDLPILRTAGWTMCSVGELRIYTRVTY